MYTLIPKNPHFRLYQKVWIYVSSAWNQEKGHPAVAPPCNRGPLKYQRWMNQAFWHRSQGPSTNPLLLHCLCWDVKNNDKYNIHVLWTCHPGISPLNITLNDERVEPVKLAQTFGINATIWESFLKPPNLHFLTIFSFFLPLKTPK